MTKKTCNLAMACFQAVLILSAATLLCMGDPGFVFPLVGGYIVSGAAEYAEGLEDEIC